MAAVETGERSIPAATGGAVLEKGRVLLLEADPCFRGTIKDCLAEAGYKVVAAGSSKEGLTEVMAGDFAAVLYDPLMPGMRDDMFYASLERIDPDLCERFVFMTSDRVDPGTMEFIRNINGVVLRKPFDVKNLLASFALIEMRGTFQSVFERASSEGVPSRDAGAPKVVPGDGDRPAGDSSLADKVAGILSRSRIMDEGDGAGSSPKATRAGNERVPHSSGTASLEKGRVLVIEGDPALRGGIRDCLSGNGYTVAAVRDPEAGLLEIFAGDFQFVLYDPAVPGMPASKFHQSVKRIEPNLCDRFLFMVGNRIDADTNRFIRKIDGFVLRKPFKPADILDGLVRIEAGGAFEGVFEKASSDPVQSRIYPVEDDTMSVEVVSPQKSGVAEEAAGVLAPVVPDSMPGLAQGAQAESEPELPSTGGAPVFLLAGLALVIVLTAGLWKPYWDTRGRVDAAEANRLALEGEWAAISRKMEEALATRSKNDVIARQLAGISVERATPRWMPALRSVVACAGLAIQVREVRANEKFGDEKMWVLLIGGVSTGADPRAVADRYRADLQRDLERIFPSGLSVRLDQFEDLSDAPSALPNGRRGKFTITATIRFGGEARTENKEGA